MEVLLILIKIGYPFVPNTSNWSSTTSDAVRAYVEVFIIGSECCMGQDDRIRPNDNQYYLIPMRSF